MHRRAWDRHATSRRLSRNLIGRLDVDSQSLYDVCRLKDAETLHGRCILFFLQGIAFGDGSCYTSVPNVYETKTPQKLYCKVPEESSVQGPIHSFAKSILCPVTLHGKPALLQKNAVDFDYTTCLAGQVFCRMCIDTKFVIRELRSESQKFQALHCSWFGHVGDCG